MGRWSEPRSGRVVQRTREERRRSKGDIRRGTRTIGGGEKGGRERIVQRRRGERPGKELIAKGAGRGERVPGRVVGLIAVANLVGHALNARPFHRELKKKEIL